jgi:hypothetical protein
VRKGKQVNIPVLLRYSVTKVLFLTLWGRLSKLVCFVNQDKSVEYHNDEKRSKPEMSLPMEDIADPWSP